MKNSLILLFSCSLILLFSCKQASTKKNTFQKEKNDSLFILKYAVIKPKYVIEFPEKLEDTLYEKYKNTQVKLKNFLGTPPLDPEVDDAYAVPDYAFEGLNVWVTSEYPTRTEIGFDAKKISKYYGFFYDKNELLLVTETFEGVKKTTDSLFFHNNKIFLWKNTSNQYVTDRVSLKGKSKYIMRLDREIKEIKKHGFTQYIDDYEYKNDSLSNFVIGNLKPIKNLKP